MSVKYLEDVREMVADKKNKYKDMLDIAYMQHVLICEDNTLRLLDNIEMRQRVIEEIKEIDRKIEMCDALENPECIRTEQEILGIRKEIAKQDRINEVAARNKILEYSNAIKKGNDIKRSYAYIDSATYSSGIFIDQNN